MKQFDSISIANRIRDKLAANPEWKAALDKSVIDAIVRSSAEANSEIARYAEYLYNESKWDTAQNKKAITAIAGMLGYRPSRKKSALGKIYISADPRIHQIGKTLIKDLFLNGFYNAGWVTPINTLYLNEQVVVTSSAGIPYKLTSAAELGGGKVFTTLDLIQGKSSSVSLTIDTVRSIATRSKLDPYIYIPVLIANCENASEVTSRSFFRVFVERGSLKEEYRVVDTLHLSTSIDKDVEVYADMYNPELLYLKFNASANRGKVLNLSQGSGVTAVTIEYLETLGTAGNIASSFDTFTVTNIPGFAGTTLYGINFDAILGGKESESLAEIKEKAPVFYLKTYTTATKEAYENIIKEMDFNGYSPTKVNVYADTVIDDRTGALKNITAITFLMPTLEDLLEEADAITTIERSLNFNLLRVKAPTDILKFIPPYYVRMGLGVKCVASKSLATNIPALVSQIRATLDSKYGSTSSELDFNRSIYETELITVTKNISPAILQVSTEIEAIKKLNWGEVVRMKPSASVAYYTARLPFNFDALFAGRLNNLGFRDYRTGASYNLRFDVFYKKTSTSTLADYNTTIFVKEAPRTEKAFYVRRDAGSSLLNLPIWDEATASAADYPFTNSDYEELANAGYQYYFKPTILSDSQFDELVDSGEGLISLARQNPGALDSYFIAFNGNYDSTSGYMGEGYLELDVAAIYTTLLKYAEQDFQLGQLLNLYPLSLITCNTTTTAFDGFIRDVVSTYVEIYVSARPNDKNLTPTGVSSVQNRAVLYADSFDSSSSDSNLSNLTGFKYPRMLSVEVETRDY